MKTLFFLLLLALSASAHIGSPNVFYEGHAGPHAVRVVIRPPAALPGMAQVDVRVSDSAITGVTVRPAFVEAGSGAAAEPVPALAAAGDAHLFHATCWLLRRGNYAVLITLQTVIGTSSVEVPLQAASLVPPTMSPALASTLGALGLLLFAAAAALAGAAAREAALPADTLPSLGDIRRGRRASALALVVLGSALAAGAGRWWKMDADFRANALFRPTPVLAAVQPSGLLRITPTADAAWDSVVTDHGKLMHCFLVREPSGDAFAHLHPVRRDATTFETLLPPLPAGKYTLYGEITHDTGTDETLLATVQLPATTMPPQRGWTMLGDALCMAPSALVDDAPAPTALDFDDSWHIAETAANASECPLPGGYLMVFETPGELLADRDTALRFAVFDAAGKGAPIQPYMGMAGHAVIRRRDGSVFTHLHPAGTISMAAQQLLTLREKEPLSAPPAAADAGNEILYPYAFPTPGEYRIWVQTRIAGRVHTGVFDVVVKPQPQ